MNKLSLFFIFLLTVNIAFGSEAKIKWESTGSAVDGDIHNLLRFIIFESQGHHGILLWKSSGHTRFDLDNEGYITGINGTKIVLKDLGEVNYIDENYTSKCIDSKNVKFSRNIRNYISPKLGIKLPVIHFRPMTE